METRLLNITKVIAGILVVVLFAGLALWAKTQGLLPKQFGGNVIVGLANPDLDPLLSGNACFSGDSSTLRVVNLAGAVFDWYVTPPSAIISVPGGSPMAELQNEGSEVIVTPPTADDPNSDVNYLIEVVPDPGLPGAGSGEIFEIHIGPPCVTNLQFSDPSGTVMQGSGEIEINSIRAVLSNGDVATYDASEIAQLPIEFVVEPAGTNVRVVGNRILVPADAPEARVSMRLEGNAVAPVVFDPQSVARDAGSLTRFTLADDEVDPTSITVFESVGGEIGDIVPETNWSFTDAPHDENPATDDSINWISPPAAPTTLFIGYLVRRSEDFVVSSVPLTITPLQCELLEANLYQGRGQGFYFPDAGDTPGTAPAGSRGSISVPFDFGSTINSILIQNPEGNGTSTPFELLFNFVTVLAERAVLTNQAGTHYEISVRNEGAGNPMATASNFAYAVNSVLGEASPFIAYIDFSNNNRVRLHSVEVGVHTNGYNCSRNGSMVPVCFTGGSTGTRTDGTAILEVDPPRPLDPVMNQGETRVVYSRGGVSDLAWRSSDASILSVEPLSEATSSEEVLLGNEHVLLNAGTVGMGNFTLPVAGAPIASTSECQFQNVGEPPMPQVQNCRVTLSAPVTFNPEAAGYSITILPPNGNPIPGIVQGSPVTGVLTGSNVINAIAGGMVQLTGQFTIPVGGDAVGSLQANVTLMAAISPFDQAELINDHWSFSAVTGTLTKVSLIPSDRTPDEGGAAITNFAILTGKRPGRATLFVSDAIGCSAPLEVEVLAEKLFIDFENPIQGEFIEQGDSIQLRAWTGFARGEVNSETDVTNRATWESDNTSVVTVNSTGRVTALQPGVANVTARFNTQVPETGELVSQGHLRVHVDELHGLTITLDRATLDRLSEAERNSAYRSVAVLVNDSGAAGKSINIEGTSVPVTLPVPTIPYASELDQIRGITRGINAFTGLINTLDAIPGIRVTGHPTLPGALILEVIGGNNDQDVDISTTATPEEITILPAFSGGVNLPASETYQMMVTGEYDSGRTRLLPGTAVTWAATPVNILEGPALETGLLRRGDAGGTANVVARFENPDHTLIQSNTLSVRIPEGPVIEFVRRIGTSAITRGSRVNLLARVSDIGTVEDIQQIDAFLVRSNGNTYQAINADTAATWFTAETFLNETQVAADQLSAASGSAAPAESGAASSAPPAAAPSAPAAPAGQAPTASQFRNYEIPIEIPVDATLFDGPYRLLFSIHDRANHAAHFVMPILIGEVASGDVSGDGRLTMIDVILAFQIANGRMAAPTNAQLQAANLDGRGNVTMIDVILLFVQVNRPT